MRLSTCPWMITDDEDFLLGRPEGRLADGGEGFSDHGFEYAGVFEVLADPTVGSETAHDAGFLDVDRVT